VYFIAGPETGRVLTTMLFGLQAAVMSKSETAGAGAAAGPGAADEADALGAAGAGELLFDVGWLPEHALRMRMLAMANQLSAVPALTLFLIRLHIPSVI